MASFLPVAVLLSLLVTGATAGGYGSQTAPSPSTATPYTSTPTTPPPPPPPTSQHATPPKPAHGYDDDDKKLVVVAVLVEGLVLCQSCEKRGSQSLDGAAPLQGAKVAVTCPGSKNRVMVAVTDHDGYFHAEFSVESSTDYLGKDPRGACLVRLLSSSDPKCNIITNIHGGLWGAPVHDEGKHWIDGRGFKNVVRAAHPLAFRPAKCAHH